MLRITVGVRVGVRVSVRVRSHARKHTGYHTHTKGAGVYAPVDVDGAG